MDFVETTSRALTTSSPRTCGARQCCGSMAPTSACRRFLSPSSWSSCSTPVRSRRAAPSTICSRGPFHLPAWSRPRGGNTMASRWRSRRSAWAFQRSLRADCRLAGKNRLHPALPAPTLIVGGDPLALDASPNRDAGWRNHTRCQSTPTIRSRRCSVRARSAANSRAGAGGGDAAAGGRWRRRPLSAASRPGSRISRAGDRRRAGRRADADRSLEGGKPVDAPAGSIAADSLAPRRRADGSIAQQHVDRVLLVDDEGDRAGAGDAQWDRSFVSWSSQAARPRSPRSRRCATSRNPTSTSSSYSAAPHTERGLASPRFRCESGRHAAAHLCVSRDNRRSSCSGVSDLRSAARAARRSLPDHSDDPISVLDAIADAGRTGTVASQGRRAISAS